MYVYIYIDIYTHTHTHIHTVVSISAPSMRKIAPNASSDKKRLRCCQYLYFCVPVKQVN